MNRCAAYVLCTNPRSGTTLLCDMLARTGVAGRPNSFFRQADLAEWCDDWNVAGPVDLRDPGFLRRYLDAMLIEGRAKTAVFGLRLMGPDLQLACNWLDRAFPGHSSAQARFDAAFGPTRFIHLSREDKLDEAISYIRAEQTGLWHQRPDGSEYEQLEPSAAGGFDAAAIRHRMEELAGLDAAWRDWFAAEGLRPLQIGYDELAKNPQKTLAGVLDFIGQDPSCAEGMSPGLRKLADATTAEWIARYKAVFPAGE